MVHSWPCSSRCDLSQAWTLRLGGARPREQVARSALIIYSFNAPNPKAAMSTSQERSAAGSFVERHGLWSEEQFDAARKAERLIEEQGLEVVRLSFPDQHGILRGKQLMAGDAARAMRNGCNITTTLLVKDTSQRSVFAVFTPG